MKEIKDMTYDELVSTACQYIHAGLLEGGGKGMRQAVWLWLDQAIQWNKTAMNKKDKK